MDQCKTCAYLDPTASRRSMVGSDFVDDANWHPILGQREGSRQSRRTGADLKEQTSQIQKAMVQEREEGNIGVQ